MKIAVACLNDNTVSAHFGRCKQFIKYKIEDGCIVDSESVANNAGCGSMGGCHGHDHEQPHAPHSHDGIVDLLDGCEAVICGGMGPEAAQDLVRRGIKPIILGQLCTPEQAVLLYASGRLTLGAGGDCCHGKDHQGK